MPQVTLPPNQTTALSGGLARTERIERRTVGTKRPTTKPDPIIFSSPTAQVANVESGRWYPNQNVVIVSIRISLLANASANHTIEVRVDGAAIQQFTLLIGTATVVTACAIPVGTDSYATVKYITATDANLTIQPTLQ